MSLATALAYEVIFRVPVRELFAARNNADRAGRNCGKRSAYSRPGGRSPLCYESDVTKAMVDEYRARKK